MSGTGIEGGGERRIGIFTIHAIENENVFARADVIELKIAPRSLKTPEAGSRSVVPAGAIKLPRCVRHGLSVRTANAAMDPTGRQRIHVIFVAGSIGDLER